MANPLVIGPTDRISRFLYDDKHYNETNRRVKPAAFARKPSDPALSTFHTEGLAEARVWLIGETIRAEPVLARADFGASIVKAHGLVLDPDNVPERHVGIKGWPADDRELELELRKKLARDSTLVLYRRAADQTVSS